MLAKPQGFPRKLGGCAGLDPRLRSAVSAGVGDGERGLRRGLRAPGVGVRPKWVLEYSPSNKRIRYFVSITYVRTGLWTAHKFCGGGRITSHFGHPIFTPSSRPFAPSPSSAAPQSQILEIAGLFLRSAQSVATESDANLGANSVKLFLSGPLLAPPDSLDRICRPQQPESGSLSASGQGRPPRHA